MQEKKLENKNDPTFGVSALQVSGHSGGSFSTRNLPYGVDLAIGQAIALSTLEGIQKGLDATKSELIELGINVENLCIGVATVFLDKNELCKMPEISITEKWAFDPVKSKVMTALTDMENDTLDPIGMDFFDRNDHE